MKKILLSLAIVAMGTLYGQDNLTKLTDANKSENSKFVFTPVITLKHTSVKDQSRSGTCWSYAGNSFLESEAMRMGKGELDLSEMFTARNTYVGRAEIFVRMHGDFSYGDGGQLHDVIDMYRKYGAMPQSAYTGLGYGTKLNDIGEMQDGLLGYLKAIVKQDKLTPSWKEAFTAAMDAYLGEVPQTFSYNGKNYDAMSFAKQCVGINPDDYIEIISVESEPKYENVRITVQDNWSLSKAFNVNLEDITAIIDNALAKGYTVAWAADVSEKYFSRPNGIAYVPEKEYADMTPEERKTMFDTPPSKERVITPQMRKDAYDFWQTTDDHGMHIVGLAKDQNGREYYLVKNSWGIRGDQKGYVYVTKAYASYKTMAIMLHKDAVPERIIKQYKK